MVEHLGSNKRNRRHRKRCLKVYGQKWCIVYGLVDPEDLRIRYIGQTRDIKQRLRYHLRHAREGRIGPTNSWLRGLIAKGKEPNIHIIEAEAVWDVSEIIWIERHRQMGADLLNIMRGGQDVRLKTPKPRRSWYG